MQIFVYWKIILEIALLWYFIYLALYFIKGTRTEQLLKGLVIIGIIFILTQQLRLESINWALTRLFPISVIALVVIFQPELRRGLTQLGQFGRYQGDLETIEEVSRATIELSKRKIGALIALEREVGLKNYSESGTPVDSKITQEIILSIFTPRSPLHDGALIIERGRIVAAGCLLPLNQEPGLSKELGTRHRAAIGLSEETDAICIVVSEETGGISISVSGKMTRDLDQQDLARVLNGMFHKQAKKKGPHLKILSKLSPKVNQ